MLKVVYIYIQDFDNHYPTFKQPTQLELLWFVWNDSGGKWRATDKKYRILVYFSVSGI